MSPRKKDPPVQIIEDDRWTPKLSREKDGSYRYCAPGCGGGSTLASYERARALAMVTASRMGRGWTWRVWENLGWHCKVFDPSGYVAIYPPGGEFRRGSFSVMVDDERFGSAGRWSLSDDDPHRALAALAKIIRIEANLVTEIADAVGRAAKVSR